MLQKYGLRILLSIASILAALLVLLAYITQSVGIQIIFIQPVYWILDRNWGAIRTSFLLLVSFGGCAILLLDSRTRKWNRQEDGSQEANLRHWAAMRFGIFGLGLIAGLLVFYGHSCCDNPVSIYMGFPLSWLRGTTPAQHYLPIPLVPYLLQNLAQIQWYLDGFSLMVDSLFWLNVGVCFSILKRINSARIQENAASDHFEKQSGAGVNQ